MSVYGMFELEQSILNCWRVTDDIDMLFERVCEGDKLDDDDLANFLLGLKSIYDVRFEKLFKQFEDLGKEIYRDKQNDQQE